MNKLYTHSAMSLNQNIIVFSFLFLGLSCTPKLELEIIHDKIQYPESWDQHTVETEDVSSIWWEAFQDSLLMNYINMFFKDAPDYTMMDERLSSAYYLAKINGANIYPTAGMGLSGSKTQQNSSNFSFLSDFLPPSISLDGAFDPTESYNLNFSSQWELDLWGRLISERKAAKADWKANENDLLYAKLSLIAQLSKLYFSIVEANMQMDLAYSNLEIATNIASLVEKRYLKGTKTSLDYRLAESSEARAKALYENRKTIYNNLVTELEVLLGRYPSSTLPVGKTLLIDMPSIPKMLPADIIDTRPDVIGSKYQLYAAGFRYQQSKKNLLPSISLSAGTGISSNLLENIINRDFGVWNLGANLLLPILQGGKLRSNVKLSNSQLEQAKLNYLKSILNAFKEVEQNLNIEQSIDVQIQALEIAEKQAKAAFDLASERYNSGVSDLITVLNSQSQYHDTYSQLISTYKQRIDTRVNLILALGVNYLEQINQDNKDD